MMGPMFVVLGPEARAAAEELARQRGQSVEVVVSRLLLGKLVKPVTEWMQQAIRRKFGIDLQTDNLDDLFDQQNSEQFWLLCRNRMVMGYFRYGLNRCASEPAHNHIKSIKDRCELYLKDGNLEHLVDIANMAQLEFMKAPHGRGSHPNPVWDPVDDGIHTETMKT